MGDRDKTTGSKREAEVVESGLFGRGPKVLPPVHRVRIAAPELLSVGQAARLAAIKVRENGGDAQISLRAPR
ncbi:hypothetical protein MRX96_026865 [Rhipicephalus microplus]